MQTSEDKILYLSELKEDDYYFNYLVSKSKLINKNDSDFKLWNNSILEKEKEKFDYWILLPTGINRKILRLLSLKSFFPDAISSSLGLGEIFE